MSSVSGRRHIIFFFEVSWSLKLLRRTKGVSDRKFLEITLQQDMGPERKVKGLAQEVDMVGFG
jgi:hypothetical protein